MLRHYRCRSGEAVGEQGKYAAVYLVSLRFADPLIADRHAKVHSDLFEFGSWQASLLAGRSHPLNPTPPLLDQVKFVEYPANHAVPQLGNTLKNIFYRQAERQQAGILYLNSIIK